MILVFPRIDVAWRLFGIRNKRKRKGVSSITSATPQLQSLHQVIATDQHFKRLHRNLEPRACHTPQHKFLRKKLLQVWQGYNPGSLATAAVPELHLCVREKNAIYCHHDIL